MKAGSAIQAPQVLLAGIFQANRALLTRCWEKESNAGSKPAAFECREIILKKQAQRLVNPPNASLVQAGFLAPGQDKYAEKRELGLMTAGMCGTPAAARDLDDPGKLQRAQIFFCCKCKGWTAAHQLPCLASLSPELLQGDTRCFPSLSPATPQAQSQQRRAPAGLLQAPEPAAGVSTVRGSTALHFHLQRALQR